MRLPKSFNDLTVGQYQAIYFLLKENTLESWMAIISELSGVPYKKVCDLPIKRVKHLIKILGFVLRTETLTEKVNQYAAIGGRFYKATLKANHLSAARAIDIKSFLVPIQGMDQTETTIVNMHKLLATIYLPLTIRGYRYDSANHERTANRFKKARLGDVYGAVFFYSILWRRLTNCLQDYTREADIVLTEHAKEIQEWMKERGSIKDGIGKTRSMNYRGGIHSKNQNTTPGTGSGS